MNFSQIYNLALLLATVCLCKGGFSPLVHSFMLNGSTRCCEFFGCWWIFLTGPIPLAVSVLLRWHSATNAHYLSQIPSLSPLKTWSCFFFLPFSSPTLSKRCAVRGTLCLSIWAWYLYKIHSVADWNWLSYIPVYTALQAVSMQLWNGEIFFL